MLSNLIASASTKYRGLLEDKKLINLSCRLQRMTSQKKQPFLQAFPKSTPCKQFGQLFPNQEKQKRIDPSPHTPGLNRIKRTSKSSWAGGSPNLDNGQKKGFQVRDHTVHFWPKKVGKSGEGSSRVVISYPQWQGHQELSGESDENNPLKPNQSAPSIYIMIEICYFSLDQ